MKSMTKKVVTSAVAASIAISNLGLSAAAITHKVVPGDTMWKIAVKYNVGTSEIIGANKQISNPNKIYPGDVLEIPTLDPAVAALEQEVFRLINIIRVENGLTPFKEDWELSRVARYKSQDMKDKNYFSHTSPTFGSPYDMMKSFGITYRSAGENIAYGFSTAAKVVDGWMNSAGHKKNILNPNYTHMGVGYVKSGNYWTQMFIQK